MTWWLPTKMVRAEKGQGLPYVPLGHKKGRSEGTQLSMPDLLPFLYHQPMGETWKLTSLETHRATSRRCSLFCFRYVHLSCICRWWVPVPCRAEPISLPQGAREEDDVVSEDLVEQDAKVRFGGSL